ncbi:D-alanyl-D-alanine carboxypeptidase family protein [uncultured Ferrovibrio sp.]|jgi:D-alanyl-D-alanine carboxypeptidase (penicillin-binding protein 5/6)|uniref:D-alanyl-D-alanine carboxypeptidase family protein n=1 Tax=uncultured Ferrovibrio sp. TaxID=1576913 RepID=UPI00261D4641|nr:D-alanyl-D-alanine carboxypeptidase family protein [uncultured Ferrovibrio sp.]
MRVSLWIKSVAATAFAVALALANPAAAQLGQVDTTARQMILVDYDTGAVLFEKNADELMPPSSMSKLMTAFMVFEQLAAGKLRLDDEFPVSEKAWRMQGSKMFVPLGGRVKVEDLLRGVIVQSGNDACIVLAEGIAGTEERFAEMMNERARELGLTKSVFRNASGWPDPEHVMTTRELALLAKHIIQKFPQYYGFYSEKEFTYGIDAATKKPITQGNRNPLLYKSIGADGLKTGHTEAAGYGLTASAKRGDRRLILVVNGLKSMNERSRESERLLELGFSQFDNYKLFSAGAVVDEADVWLGSQSRLPLIVERDLTVTMPRQARSGVKVTVTYDNPIPAPIVKGTPVATLTVAGREGTLVEMPLVAGADVELLGFTGRVGAAVSYLLWGASKQ